MPRLFTRDSSLRRGRLVAPLLALSAVLLLAAACESVPRNDGWSMFDREGPTRRGS